MHYKIILFPTAVSDIEDAYNYIFYSLQNPFAAIGTVREIKKQIDSLASNPERQKFNEKYYYVRAKRYKIYYHISDDKVCIVRVIHSSRKAPVLH